MNEADYIARIRYWITQRERDPERTYTSAELLDACDLLRDYDALAARLADKEKLLADAVAYGTDYKQARDDLMGRYQMTLARLAEAERDRLEATKLLFDWEITSNRTGSVMDETRAYLKRVGYDPMTATLRATDSAKPDNAPAECLCEKVGTGERLPRCANYPKCICGGPEGWPEVSAPAARTRSQQRRISLMRGEPMPDFDAPPGSAPALNPEQLDRANVELACESVKLQEALAFYAERQHIAFTDEAERARWETGSDPEAPNWMDREGLDMMIEDGGVAREALKPFDSTTVTVKGGEAT